MVFCAPTSVLTRLLALLGLTPLSAAQRDLEQMRRRVRAERAARQRAERRGRELRDRVTRFRARLAAVRAKAHHLEELHGSARDRLLARMPLRLEALRARQDDAVVTRAAEFAARSTAYRDAETACASGTLAADARRISIGGVVWHVPHDDGGSLARRILEQQWLPFADVATVRQYVVGGVMLDIGANIGTTSIPRVVLGDFAASYCAEPDAGNYACLVATTLRNQLGGRVLPDRVAISSTTGTARFRRAEQIGGHKIVAENTGHPSRVELVPCFTLDTWLDRINLAAGAVSFVKIDTQGWDLHVLQGAPSLLAQRHIVWQIEVSPLMMQSAGSRVEELADLIEARFTHVRDLRGRGARPVPSADVRGILAGLTGDRQFTNLLCLNLG